MKIENLKVGETYKNYKVVCEVLDEPIKTGKAKQLQLKRWEEYFDWQNEGQKWIVTNIKVVTCDCQIAPINIKDIYEVNGSEKLSPIEGETYSLNELVKYFLNEELAKSGGNKWRRQRAQIDCFCRIIPQGNKWLVKEIYDVELDREDGRNKSIFLPKGEINKILLLTFLKILKENNEQAMLISIPTLELYTMLGLTNSNFHCLRYETDWIEQLEFNKEVSFYMQDWERWLDSKMITMSNQLIKTGGIGASKVKWRTLVLRQGEDLINVTASNQQVLEIELCEDITIKQWNELQVQNEFVVEGENGENTYINTYERQLRSMNDVKYLSEKTRNKFYTMLRNNEKDRGILPSNMVYSYKSYYFTTNVLKLERAFKKMGIQDVIDMTIDELNDLIIKEMTGVNAKHVEIQMQRFLNDISNAQDKKPFIKRGMGRRGRIEIEPNYSIRERIAMEVEKEGIIKLLEFMLDINHVNTEREDEVVMKAKSSSKEKAIDFNTVEVG